MTKLLLGALLLAGLILLALRREFHRVELERVRRAFTARLSRELGLLGSLRIGSFELGASMTDVGAAAERAGDAMRQLGTSLNTISLGPVRVELTSFELLMGGMLGLVGDLSELEDLDPRCPECTGEVALSTGVCLDCGHDAGPPQLPGLHGRNQAPADDDGPLTVSAFMRGRPAREEPDHARFLADLLLPQPGPAVYEEVPAATVLGDFADIGGAGGGSYQLGGIWERMLPRLFVDESMPGDRVEVRSHDGRVLRTIIVGTTPSPRDDRAQLNRWVASGRAGVDPDAAYFEWSPREAFGTALNDAGAGELVDVLLDDPDTWRAANPPMARGAHPTGLFVDEAMTLSDETVQAILDAMPETPTQLIYGSTVRDFPRVTIDPEAGS